MGKFTHTSALLIALIILMLGLRPSDVAMSQTPTNAPADPPTLTFRGRLLPAIQSSSESHPLSGYQVHPSTVIADDHYAYFLLESRIYIIDFFADGGPAVIGSVSTNGGWGTDIIKVGQYIYGSGTLQSMNVIDVADPKHPTLLPDAESPGRIQALTTRGNYLFAGTGYPDWGILIYTLSDPAAPKLISSTGNINTSIGAISVFGNRLYVGGTGVDRVDITDPYHPNRIGYSGINGYDGTGFAVNYPYAYEVTHDATAGKGFLYIIDLSQSYPQTITTMDLGPDAYDLVKLGNYLYIANGTAGLRVMRLSDPTHPVEIGHIPTSGSTISLDYANRELYVYDSDEGITMYDVDLYDIQGTVKDLQGNPLSGVAVTADQDETVRTDIDGSYKLRGLKAGNYNISTALDGYFFNPPSSTVSVPPDRADVNFQGGEPTIQGMVVTSNGSPYQGVTILREDLSSQVTGADGSYRFGPFSTGTYTLTPQMAGRVFSPPSLAITFPPYRQVIQNFTILPEPVQINLDPEAETTSPYLDLQGLPTQLTFPAGSVPQATQLMLTPTVMGPRLNWSFSGHAFTLSTLDGSTIQFNSPVKANIQYSLQDIRSTADESQLDLWRWNGETWTRAEDACPGGDLPVVDTANHIISAPICSTGSYGLYGVLPPVYLPLILH